MHRDSPRHGEQVAQRRRAPKPRTTPHFITPNDAPHGSVRKDNRMRPLRREVGGSSKNLLRPLAIWTGMHLFATGAHHSSLEYCLVYTKPKPVVSSSLGGYATQKVALVYKECERCAGLFEAELSGTWLSDPGTYVLEVRSEDSEDPSVVTLSFDTFDPSRAQIAQGAVVGTLGACIIAGMCFMIYRNPKRAKQLLLSFVTTEFKMLFTTTSEVWDIVGARPLLEGQRYVGLKC